MHTFRGHKLPVVGVALSADGSLLASASYDRTVKLWDVKTRTELRTLHGHTNFVMSVALSADGSLVISASDDKTIKIWDAMACRDQRNLRGHTDSVERVVLSADGSLLASASFDSTVKLWDVKAGTELHTLGGYPGWVVNVALSANGKAVSARYLNGKIISWEVATGKALDRAPVGLELVESGSGSRRGKLLALPYLTKFILLVDLAPPSPADHRALQLISTPDPFWHQEQIAKHEKEGNLLAAVFHRGRLADLSRGPEAVKTWQAFLDACAKLEDKKSARPLTLFLGLSADAPADHLHRVALARLALGEEKGFHAMCQKLYRLYGLPQARRDVLCAAALLGHADTFAASAWVLAELAAHQETPANLVPLILAGTLHPESGLDAKCLLNLAQDAVKIDPDNPDLRQALGAALYRTGQYKEAEETLAAIFPKGEETNGTRLFLALACQRQGKTDKAGEWLAKVAAAEATANWMERVIVTTLRAEFESLAKGK